MTDEDTTTSPVRQARNDALAAKLRYDQGRHGLAQQKLEVLRRQWQTYLWHYYSQIAGYQNTRNLEEKWYEPILEGTHPDSLDDLQEYQFSVETKEERRTDSFSGVTKRHERTQPAVWPAEALRAISAKLDECYHELGFDEPPRTVVKTSGYVGNEHPDWFSEDFTLDLWKEFVSQIDPDGDANDPVDDAIELAVGNVQREKAEESGPEDNHHEQG
jgi:hypothetical protein